MALLLVAALAALLFVNQEPAEEVSVLPGPEGRTGTVVVQRGDERFVLDQPYATLREGESSVVHITPDEVKKSYGAVIAALPARPASFQLYFVSGSDELTEESQRELDKILAELKRRPVPDVAVVAHTDSVGEAEWNDALSLQRAETTKAYLIDVGIAAERIQTAGRGEREPLVPTADNVDEPKNRRVEITVR